MPKIRLIHGVIYPEIAVDAESERVGKIESLLKKSGMEFTKCSNFGVVYFMFRTPGRWRRAARRIREHGIF